MCGPTGAQSQLQSGEVSFAKAMQDEYNTVFGQNQNILSDLTGSLSPIVAAGPSQQGFSAAENAALNTQATDQAAQNVKQVRQATNERMAAAGGGNTFLPSGAQEQINAGINTSAMNELSNERLGITEANYQAGRENWLNAVKDLETAPGATENPTSEFANATSNSSKVANDEANTIAAQGNSWMGLVGGLAGNVVGAAGPGIVTKLFGKQKGGAS